MARVSRRAAAAVPDGSLAADELLLAAVRASRLFASGRSLLRYAAQTAPAGIACEFGVFTGTTLREIRDVRKPPVFGFDTFTGLPKSWDTGGDLDHPAGTFACSPPANLANGVRLVPGLFADTLPEWKAKYSGPVQFLHVDCDLYESARDVLLGLDDRIVAGSVVVFDELVDFGQTNYPKWREGEWRALNEWIAERSRTVEPIGRTGHQQAAFVVRV